MPPKFLICVNGGGVNSDRKHRIKDSCVCMCVFVYIDTHIYSLHNLVKKYILENKRIGMLSGHWMTAEC